MPKFFVSQNQIKEDSIYIEGQDVNHIRKVLRAEVGDILEICDKTNQKNYDCKIEEINEKTIKCAINKELDTNAESNIKVTIFQGLPKADKMELVIQKSVELGVFEIIPVKTERCIVKLDKKNETNKINRWNKISEVAAKQCGRDFIPKIKDPININDICNLRQNYDIVLVAYEKEEKNTLKNELLKLKENIQGKEKISIGVLIGPEGGLEIHEVKKLQELGAKVITLGKRILRTETVALNVLSNIMYELDENI